MHSPPNVKFDNAKQTNETYQYKNTKEKLCKTNAVIFPYMALQPLPALASLIRSIHSSPFSNLLLHPLIVSSCNASL